ncbi:MAG TPA: hypothetical protein VGC97_13840 [Pyrinomonadaceae bacterium]
MDRQWSGKTEKYTLYSLIVAIIGIVIGAIVAIYNPEIREKLGLGSNTNIYKPQEVLAQPFIGNKKSTPEKLQNPPQTDRNNKESDFAGNWQGQLLYSSGATYIANISLSGDGKGKIKGQIIWTLQRTANPQKADKINLTATEFIRGTFDENNKTLNLMGYDKDDPGNLGIILDKYILSLSDDGLQITGNSYGGKTTGNFTLKRF